MCRADRERMKEKVPRRWDQMFTGWVRCWMVKGGKGFIHVSLCSWMMDLMEGR
jgi:hypothetical protein